MEACASAPSSSASRKRLMLSSGDRQAIAKAAKFAAREKILDDASKTERELQRKLKGALRLVHITSLKSWCKRRGIEADHWGEKEPMVRAIMHHIKLGRMHGNTKGAQLLHDLLARRPPGRPRAGEKLCPLTISQVRAVCDKYRPAPSASPAQSAIGQQEGLKCVKCTDAMHKAETIMCTTTGCTIGYHLRCWDDSSGPKDIWVCGGCLAAVRRRQEKGKERDTGSEDSDRQAGPSQAPAAPARSPAGQPHQSTKGAGAPASAATPARRASPDKSGNASVSPPTPLPTPAPPSGVPPVAPSPPPIICPADIRDAQVKVWMVASHLIMFPALAVSADSARINSIVQDVCPQCYGGHPGCKPSTARRCRNEACLATLTVCAKKGDDDTCVKCWDGYYEESWKQICRVAPAWLTVMRQQFRARELPWPPGWPNDPDQAKGFLWQHRWFSLSRESMGAGKIDELEAHFLQCSAPE
jgi:hypothetical protein